MEKTHLCDACNNMYATRSTLATHRRKIHGLWAKGPYSSRNTPPTDEQVLGPSPTEAVTVRISSNGHAKSYRLYALTLADVTDSVVGALRQTLTSRGHKV